MNRVLTWGLVATCALSAWALASNWNGAGVKKGAGVVAPVVRTSAGMALTTDGGDSRAELPSTWPKPDMDVAARSPFESPPPPSPTALIQPMAMAPPPPPPALPATYRFWGRMSSPENHMSVFLAKGPDGMPVVVQAGTRLEDAWIVDAISDNTIVLANAGTQQRTTIFVPPADAGPSR